MSFWGSCRHWLPVTCLYWFWYCCQETYSCCSFWMNEFEKCSNLLIYSCQEKAKFIFLRFLTILHRFVYVFSLFGTLTHVRKYVCCHPTFCTNLHEAQGLKYHFISPPTMKLEGEGFVFCCSRWPQPTLQQICPFCALSTPVVYVVPWLCIHQMSTQSSAVSAHAVGVFSQSSSV